MNAYISIVEDNKLSPKERREKLISLADNSTISSLVILAFRETSKEKKRLYVRTLADLALNKSVRALIDHQFVLHRDIPSSIVSDDDPKVRKNAYELLGRLQNAEYLPLLMIAHEKEETLYVLPSVILALGRYSDRPDVRDLLKNGLDTFIPLNNDKNDIAIKESYIKATNAFSEREPLLFTDGDHMPFDVILTCPNARITQKDLSGIGINAMVFDAVSGLVLAKDIRRLRSLYSVRSFYDMGIYITDGEKPDKLLNDDSISFLITVLKELYGRDDLHYRVDVTGRTITKKERADAVKITAAALMHTGLINDVSSYDIEFRYVFIGQKFVLALFPGSVNDNRFSYRKKAISASMHPAVAASVCSVIKDNSTRNARIIDCFCGAGTLILERSFFPYGKLYASDISNDALSALNVNARTLGVKIEAFPHNAVQPFREKFDEVLANMPFGLRVSSHTSNEKLYSEFSDNLYSMLEDNGIAYMFTNDKKLFSDVFTKRFEITGRIRFQAGGLYPTLFILKKNS